MKLLAKILEKSVRLNKTRRTFSFLGRDYILAVRTKKSNGYRLVRHLGNQRSRREFDAYHMGYITVYKSVDKFTLYGGF